MDQLLEQFSLNFEDSFSPSQYILFITLCAVLLYLLSLVYRRYGQSISNRAQLAKVLMIVGLTTFIIISIVKSSLALSLGLVGALSIVRFRTAIKEPEELGYFFMAIAIGLGMGANQLLPTLIGFIILMGIVILQSGSGKSSITQNLLISLQSPEVKTPGFIDKISDAISSNSAQLAVKRIQQKDERLAVNFQVKVNALSDLNRIHQALHSIDDNMDITFIDNTL